MDRERDMMPNPQVHFQMPGVPDTEPALISSLPQIYIDCATCATAMEGEVRCRLFDAFFCLSTAHSLALHPCQRMAYKACQYHKLLQESLRRLFSMKQAGTDRHINIT